MSDGDPLLVRLVTVDIASWFILKPAMLDLLAHARQKGLSLSLLSNAPHKLADRISGHSAFGMFDQLLFSARLGLSKPDPAIYEAALARLAVAADEVLFVDDRAENIAAAADVGLRTFHYVSDDALADRLDAWATSAVGELRSTSRERERTRAARRVREFPPQRCRFGGDAVAVPQIRDALHLRPGPLGLLLLVAAIGSLVSLPLAGSVVHRFGSGRTAMVMSVMYAMDSRSWRSVPASGRRRSRSGCSSLASAPASGTSPRTSRAPPSNNASGVRSWPASTPRSASALSSAPLAVQR